MSQELGQENEPPASAQPSSGPAPKPASERSLQRGPIMEAIVILRNRVIAGFFVALPFIITFILIRWLYDFIARDIIAGIARLLLRLWGPTLAESGLPPIFEYFLAPVAAIAVILSLLFVLGMFFQSRTHRLFDWILKRMPFVGTIYSAVSNAIESISKTRDQSEQYQRVVLVQFPHPGMKAPAFVTSTVRDKWSGKNILCIYVPTTPIPTSGYMLMVPEEDVTEISWDMSTTLQAIVSGGITVPEEVEYHGNGLIEQNSPTGKPSAEPSAADIDDVSDSDPAASDSVNADSADVDES